MNEVTAKDLRDAIEVYWDAPYYEDEDDRLNREGRRDAELAAFDAMAEKAEAYDRLNHLLVEEDEVVEMQYRDRNRTIWVKVNNVIHAGPDLKLALKAVPE